jgi:hypothetical protein
MASQQFYFVGDGLSTAQSVPVNASGKFDDLRRAVALTLHVAVPQGKELYLPLYDTVVL